MTDIPTVNYYTKFFLEEELPLANCLKSLSLMPVITLLTIHLIVYQRHDKGYDFFNFTVSNLQITNLQIINCYYPI